ncbi:MAG: hypothetical protein FRX49_13134, partial [Trebouxia sp. A1-2]
DEGIVQDMPPALLGVCPWGLIHRRAARVVAVINVAGKTSLRQNAEDAAKTAPERSVRWGRSRSAGLQGHCEAVGQGLGGRLGKALLSQPLQVASATALVWALSGWLSSERRFGKFTAAYVA